MIPLLKILSMSKIKRIVLRLIFKIANCRYKGIPTFPEFVDYLLSTDVEMYNEHWLPYYLLCTPCHLNYTVIAKTEDIADDSRWTGNKVYLLSNKYISF